MKVNVVNALISIIEDEDYRNVGDFEWLLTRLKLMILSCPPACEKRLANTLKDIMLRVKDLRPKACTLAFDLITEEYNSLFRVGRDRVEDTGYILIELLYIIGEYATDEEISAQILFVYENYTDSVNTRLCEKAKVELIRTAAKLFFKYCRRNKEVKEVHEKLVEIFEHFSLEMADTPEMFELLNFYYGIIKNWKEMGCEEVVSIMNAGFAEELPPVHKCVRAKQNLGAINACVCS
eukprot:TRINITY_DN9410_c0_g2_i3.p2 TRINITY_DN9410_c0_g2~~TRINITY_DN9410_c0_g2_i3.p2  ORF type:complete len:236 (-),score=62.03 TRINITY_DN9410_c0_g2_i3:355-1062(-)